MQRAMIVVCVLLSCSSAFGTTLMGSPTAMLDGRQFGLSIEYSRTQADITFEDSITEDFDLDTAYAVFTAAGAPWWEFYLRLGAGRADATGFDGDTNLSWGLGTRLSVFEWDDFTWGVMAQFTNIISRFDTTEEFLVGGVPVLLDTEEELDLVEYDFATGPTWRHGRLALYGGLLVRYLTGSLEFDADLFDDFIDIDHTWDAGGYVGGTLTLFKADPSGASVFARGDLVAEGRFTGDSTGFSVALLLPFGGEP